MGSLKLVKFSPNDYEIGAILHSKNQSVLSSQDQIGSAFSLYLQWPQYSKAFIKLSDSVSGDECTIEVDHESIYPDELIVNVVSKNTIETLMNQIVTIRFEIFRTCYEFTSTVLAVDDDSTLIISVPTKITTFKSRRLPRISVEGDSIRCEGENSNSLKVIEIGANTIAIDTKYESRNNIEKLKINEHWYDVKHIRSNKNKGIYSITFENESEFQNYFSFYVSISYPSLVFRNTERHKEVFNVLKETGYFKNFSNSLNDNDFFTELDRTWNKVSTSKNVLSADLLSVVNDRVVGMSSVCKSFIDKEGTPIWVMHQLCAEKNPNLLQNSGELYLWRAEYLSSFPENLSSVVWFRSKSRWLERLYVKYAKSKNTKGSVLPVVMRKVNLENFEKASDSILGLKTKQSDIGRVLFNYRELIAAVGPKYLNSSELLNHAFSLKKELSADELISFVQIVGNKTDCNEIRVSFSHKYDLDIGEKRPSDRMCIIPKEDHLELLNAIEHSIAVTKRKFNDK